MKKAIDIKVDYQEAWNNLGQALCNVGEWYEAIACFDQAIKIQPDYGLAYYNKARCYALQDKAYLAIENLELAINFDINEFYREMAKTDTDFSNISSNPKFQALIAGDIMY